MAKPVPDTSRETMPPLPHSASTAMITVYSVPDGPKVRDPQTMQHVPDEGLAVVRTTYWLRRINAGDVTTSKPTAKQAKPAKE